MTQTPAVEVFHLLLAKGAVLRSFTISPANPFFEVRGVSRFTLGSDDFSSCACEFEWVSREVVEDFEIRGGEDLRRAAEKHVLDMMKGK